MMCAEGTDGTETIRCAGYTEPVRYFTVTLPPYKQGANWDLGGGVLPHTKRMGHGSRAGVGTRLAERGRRAACAT